jgi:hypothetical protein
MAILLPELPVRYYAPVWGAIKLVQFDSYGGVQQTELRNNFVSCFRGMGYVQQGRKQVCQVEVECAQCGNELLDLVGLGIEQFYSIVDLLAKFVPVDFDERVGAGDLPHNIICDSGTFSELGQVQLFDAVALANVMHQVKGVSLASQKCHGTLPAPTSNL